MSHTYAPVVVFAYNRPDHLRQTLTALAEAACGSMPTARAMTLPARLSLR